MRFSTLSMLALPLLATASHQETPLEQAKAQVQYWFDKVSSFIPSPNKAHTPHAAAAKAGGKAVNVLTLNNWEQTIRSTVKPTSVGPEEWWILITGGNTTCFGLCGTVETAFNETAALWSVNPTAPHLGYVNCDNQPVLCNSWGAGAPSLWILEVSKAPAPVDIRIRTLNTTTTDVKFFTDLHASKEWKGKPLYAGYFHPFDGVLAQNGLAVPLGYVFWAFAVIPSWMFMIGISFISRSIMSGRTNAVNNPNPRAGGAAAAPPAAR